MSKYLEGARQAHSKIQEIQGSTTSKIRVFTEMFNDSKREIQSDRTLSAEGKDKKMDELKAKMGKQLLETLAKERDEYRQSVVKAVNESKRVLAEPLPKPHETELALHEQKVRDISLNSVFMGARETIDSISEYTEQIDDPYLANSLLDQLPTLSDRMSQSATITPQDKSKLRSVYQSLKTKADTDERREARNILSYNDGRGFDKLYGPIEENAIQERLGSGYSRYLNDPEIKLAQLEGNNE